MILNKIKIFKNLVENFENDKLILFINDCKNNELILIVDFWYKEKIYSMINLYKELLMLSYYSINDIYQEFLMIVASVLKKYKPHLDKCSFTSFLLSVVKKFTMSKIKSSTSTTKKPKLGFIDFDNLYYVIDEDASNNIEKEIQATDIKNLIKFVDVKKDPYCKYLSSDLKTKNFYSTTKINQIKSDFIQKVNFFFSFQKRNL
ncbi:hypothetical protein [Mycoplasmopsis gallinarum]|uniref:hypothetical protein n=1 Tax=Mycoplasmopsis gallinarum TaxID=29557 RepID=UPI00048874AE|nr:hypothetical protein [Mycoplasmopsis gallinarum]